MKNMISYCGLTCTGCPAFIATQSDDDAKRAEVAERWSKESNVEIKPEGINCDGCISTGRHIGHWDICEIRKCAQEKGVQNCAFCDEYACETLNTILNVAPDAKRTLDEIRNSL